jgi:hypothetical protein
VPKGGKARVVQGHGDSGALLAWRLEAACEGQIRKCSLHFLALLLIVA